MLSWPDGRAALWSALPVGGNLSPGSEVHLSHELPLQRLARDSGSAGKAEHPPRPGSESQREGTGLSLRGLRVPPTPSRLSAGCVTLVLGPGERALSHLQVRFLPAQRVPHPAHTRPRVGFPSPEEKLCLAKSVGQREEVTGNAGAEGGAGACPCRACLKGPLVAL